MKYWIIVLLLFVTIFSSAQVDNLTYTEAYDLHFKWDLDSTALYPWRGNAAYGQFTLPFHIKDADRILFSLVYSKDFPFDVNRLRTEWEQRVFLPEHHEEKGTVSFESKGENMENAFLLIDGIDNQERILYSDTVQYKPGMLLSTLSKDISLKGIKLLNFRIRGEGIKGQDARFSFSELGIKIGNQPIDSFSLGKSLPLSVQEVKPQNISITKSLNGNYGKIIGIGESMHGNSTVREFACDFILQRVESHQCKSILLERPMEECLIYDSYIQGMICRLDSNDYYLKETNLIPLLDKLKSYNANRKREERVRLWGIDYKSLSVQETVNSVFDYLISVNRSLMSPKIDQFALLLMDNNWENTFKYLNENGNTLERFFPGSQYKYIEHLLKLSVAVGTDPVERYIKRDSVMFENTRFIVDNVSDKETEVVIYAHAIHLNTVSTYPALPCTSLGAYLKSRYGEDYTPLLVLTDEGKVTIYDNRYNRVDVALSTPPCESVEYFLKNITKEDTYIPLTPYFDRLVLSRFMGSHNLRQQFFWFNLYRRYAGIFFLENKRKVSVDNERRATFEEMSKQNLNRIKSRQGILEMLKNKVNDKPDH
ncbi:erythromycin esterase family protein [Bacteroides helcogenes]|nr:erythromycin esterase family protein [Bacteroides helcogenes]MDY5238635.1 erythromycin esterase family protein [Bacteroides helcogenes]